MSGTILLVSGKGPGSGHVCNPGKLITKGPKELGGGYSLCDDPRTYAWGTVWQCDDCGKVWVRDVNRSSANIIACIPGWRPEKRRERRKRLKNGS